jgi:hypothetical protein
VAHGEHQLGADRTGARVELGQQLGIVARRRQHVHGASSVELEQPLGGALGDARRDQLGAQRRRVGDRAREGQPARDALRRLAAQPFERVVDGVLGELAVGGELAAHDRDQAREVAAVLVQHVGARHVALLLVRRVRQRPHAGVGVEDVVGGQVSPPVPAC